MDADSARLLRDAGYRFLDVAGCDHHQVVQLIDNNNDVRHVLVGGGAVWIGAGGFLNLAGAERLVVPADVPVADLGEDVVSPFHLFDCPSKRVGCFLRIGHRLSQQVRESGVLAHLDLLRVDQDQAHVVGRGAHQQRCDDAVDPARLAGAGCTGDEHVWRRREIKHHGLSGNVLTDGHFEGVCCGYCLGRDQKVTECNELALVIRHLHTDRRAPGDRRQDAHIGCCHRIRNVLLQTSEFRDFNAGAKFEFVPGNGGTDGHADQFGLDIVRRQRLLQRVPALLDRLHVDLLLPRLQQELHRRQNPLANLGTSRAHRPRHRTGARLRPRRPLALRLRHTGQRLAVGFEVVDLRPAGQRLAGYSVGIGLQPLLVEDSRGIKFGAVIAIARQRGDVADSGLCCSSDRNQKRIQNAAGLLGHRAQRRPGDQH